MAMRWLLAAGIAALTARTLIRAGDSTAEALRLAGQFEADRLRIHVLSGVAIRDAGPRGDAAMAELDVIMRRPRGN